MAGAAGPGLIQRGSAMLALAIPVAAGLAYLWQFGAPASYLVVNAGALALALPCALFARLPSHPAGLRLLILGLLALLVLPLMIGPYVEGIARWLTLGAFTVHVGMAVIPLVAVLCAGDARLGPYWLLTAILIAFAQPDAASILALSGAAMGLWYVHRDMRVGAVAALGAFAALGASVSGNPPPQPFVERILPGLWSTSPLMAGILALSLIASLVMILRAPGAAQEPRVALVGALAGFILAALLGDYPTPLIGYGAAAIIGLGLALPAITRERVQ